MISYLFYESATAFFVLLPFGIWYFFRWEAECMGKKQREFQDEFREAIQSVSASMRVIYWMQTQIGGRYEDK